MNRQILGSVQEQEWLKEVTTALSNAVDGKIIVAIQQGDDISMVSEIQATVEAYQVFHDFAAQHAEDQYAVVTKTL